MVDMGCVPIKGSVSVSRTHRGMLCRHAARAGHPQALQGGLQQLHQEVAQFAAMAAPTVVSTVTLLIRVSAWLCAVPMPCW